MRQTEMRVVIVGTALSVLLFICGIVVIGTALQIAQFNGWENQESAAQGYIGGGVLLSVLGFIMTVISFSTLIERAQTK